MSPCPRLVSFDAHGLRAPKLQHAIKRTDSNHDFGHRDRLKPGGRYDPRTILTGDVMRWRVLLEMTGTDGVTVMHEVSAGTRHRSDSSPATIGLTLVEGKTTLEILQHHLVQMQAVAYCGGVVCARDAASAVRSRTGAREGP